MNVSRKMTQRERIAWYVLRGELIDSEFLHAAFRALGGVRYIKGRAARAEWLMNNVSPETLEQYFEFQYVRICSHCGKPMAWGYCIRDGCEYYCSAECLHQHYTEEEFMVMYDQGNSDTYYTSWID